MTRQPTANFIPLLAKQESPYSLQDIENILTEIQSSGSSLLENPNAKVVVNYLTPDPVSAKKISMSGSLYPDLTNEICFALNIVSSRADNIYFIPDEHVIQHSMSIDELMYILRTTQRFNKEREALHINYLDRFPKSISRHVGIVTGFSYLKVHHSDDLDGVFILDMKLQESAWV